MTTRIEREAAEIPNGEVDNQPKIRRLLDRLAVLNAEHKTAVNRAGEFEQQIKGIPKKVEAARSAVTNLESTLPLLAAEALLGSKESEAKFSEVEQQIALHRRALRQIELAGKTLEQFASKNRQPVMTIATAINEIEGELDKERQKAKMELYRRRLA